MVGHNKSYVKVLVKRDESLIGHQIIVKVTETHKWHVYGEVIDRNPKCIHVNFYDHFKGMYEEPSKELKGNEVKYEEQINIHELLDTFQVKAKNEDKYKEGGVITNSTSTSGIYSNKRGRNKDITAIKPSSSNFQFLMIFFYLLAILFMVIGLKDLRMLSYFQTKVIV